MIKTGSVLDKLCAAVDKHRGRVARAAARVEELRDRYRVAPESERSAIAARGFGARESLAKAEGDLKAAEAALAAEEARLLQPDSFLRFG